MPDPPTRHDVFLSHNNADKPAVEELARRLAQAGLQPWLDTWNLIPGDPWQEAVEAALRTVYKLRRLRRSQRHRSLAKRGDARRHRSQGQ